MITDTVFRLKEDAQVSRDMKFNFGTEFHIVADVVYMGGFPLPPEWQKVVYNWITNNKKLFQIDHRRF